MSGKEEVGKIWQNVNYEIEWVIEDIFSYTMENKIYKSPSFSVPGSKWYLKIYPNGWTEHDSVGWFGVFLMREVHDLAPRKSLSFSLGLKKVDGTIEVIRDYGNRVIDKSSGWGAHKFLKRSELVEREYELAPSGKLTLTCIMRVDDVLDCTLRLIELSNNFKNMLMSAKSSDATLKVQDRKIPVHKSVLASRSSVFEAMFEVDMKEKSTGTVDIVDCDPQAFDAFLVYLYSGQFEISSGDAFELYKIAHKYCEEELKSACVRSILGNLSVDNIIDVAILGDQFDENEFKSKSQDFFDENFALVVPTDKWKSLLNKKPSLVNQLLNNMAKNTKIKKMKY